MKVRIFPFVLFASFAEATQRKRGNATGDYTGSPCAVVSQSARAALVSSFASTPTVSAQLAYDCLTSVPLDVSAATDLVTSILPYLQWQSDLSYLKNPPAGYLQPAVDIVANLESMVAKIKSGYYGNEHEFQTDLFKNFQAVHDGHFRFAPDLISKALHFRRPVQIVSVSRDGVEVPKVYTREDIVAYNAGNGASQPSAISKVNGEEVHTFLDSLAQLGFLQDPDALYNNLMFEMAFDAQSQQTRYTGFFALAGRYGYLYPGANTTIEFENGTINAYQNYAEVLGDFGGVVDGPSFYQKFCTGFHSATSSDQAAGGKVPVSAPFAPPTATVPAHGYPSPHVITTDQQASGYFLDDPGYSDVAVLSLLSFEPNFPVEFQTVIETFIADAKSRGKTKIIIDLCSNGGGDILLGYDAFRQFFPSIVQDGLSRMREHEGFRIASQGISQYSANFSPNDTASQAYLAYESPLNFRYDLNLTNGSFLSYEDKFKPQQFNGDNFTQIMRWNMNDDSTTINPTFGIGAAITGYGNRANFTQPFAAEDIIMVYDGYCASTCGIFSEFMRMQGGVKSIAMGGRPSTSAIQGIGGTKGANNYPFGFIQQLTNLAISTGSTDQVQAWTAATRYSDLAQNRSTDTSINVRDNILRENLEDGVPAQFIYEAADCRLFYEPAMLMNVTAMWKKAADAAWGTAKCIAGSLPHANQTPRFRRRKSEEMKEKAKLEVRRSTSRRSVLELPKSRILGKKVPWG